MAAYSFERLKPEYADLWDRMTVTRTGTANAAAKKVIRSKARYKKVEKATGIPWFVVGSIHIRESDADFATYLGNGDPLNLRTKHVPKGRGPFATWEDGAYDALVTVENLNDLTYDCVEACAYAFEKINGFGYRNPGRSGRAPYLWAGTNLQLRGKFVADNKYDPNAMDQQIGAMAVFRAITDLDPEASFDKKVSEPKEPPPPPPVPPKEGEVGPPLSPRADDTESHMPPVSWWRTALIQGRQWVATNAVNAWAFIHSNPEIFLAILGGSTLVFYLEYTGRINLLKTIKHLAQDDTA